MIDERPDISGLSVVLGLLSGHPVAHFVAQNAHHQTDTGLHVEMLVNADLHRANLGGANLSGTSPSDLKP